MFTFVLVTVVITGAALLLPVFVLVFWVVMMSSSSDDWLRGCAGEPPLALSIALTRSLAREAPISTRHPVDFFFFSISAGGVEQSAPCRRAVWGRTPQRSARWARLRVRTTPNNVARS